MKNLYDSKTVRQKFLDFMKTKEHAILPSSSLVPKEDPTVLFTTAGMQPLVPYLLGQKHPQGVRLANSQKCLRTPDLDEVGDNRHLSFFEMLGSWSLGDYFKKESIEWGFEFLTDEKWLGLDPERLFVTVYKGYGNVPADEEAIEVWKEQFAKVGIQADVGDEFDFKNTKSKTDDQKYIYRITKRSGKDNWWGLPYRGPCGPCSEIYYLLNRNSTNFEEEIFPSLNLNEIEDFIENQIVEIWNHVFMQFEGEKDENDEPKDLVPLAEKNIDTGMGFERLITVLNDMETVQETDLLKPISDVALKHSN
jgi:alanyl-tRNA synthetase